MWDTDVPRFVRVDEDMVTPLGAAQHLTIGFNLKTVHGRPRFAKFSIHDDSKEKIAPVHSDFECGC